MQRVPHFYHSYQAILPRVDFGVASRVVVAVAAVLAEVVSEFEMCVDQHEFLFYLTEDFYSIHFDFSPTFSWSPEQLLEPVVWSHDQLDERNSYYLVQNEFLWIQSSSLAAESRRINRRVVNLADGMHHLGFVADSDVVIADCMSTMD